MIRADLEDARKAWIAAAKHDADEFQRRQESDFLAVENFEGETLDLHSLRHTCGAWLAQAGVNPKTIQVVMRHSTIVLTMDAYGHLFPGSEAVAIAKLPLMLNAPAALSATGTDGTEHRQNLVAGLVAGPNATGRDAVRLADAIDAPIAHSTKPQNPLKPQRLAAR